MVFTDAPKYDMRLNPVYQIDFSAVESGKRLSASKRRVRFRFGFSSADAIANGAVGPECRGEEHEVTLVWSLTSGKRLVLADGNEVHFSKGNLTQTKFETSWTMRGNHVVKLVAYAALPLFPQPGFRQFELFLDGMSFFKMPKIYELGKNDAAIVEYSAPRGQAAAYNNYSLPPQQERRWERNVQSYEEQYQMDSARLFDSSQSAEGDFARPPAGNSEPSMPSDLMSEPTPVADAQDHLAAPIPLLDQNTASFSSSAASSTDEFAPVAPAPEPTNYATIHNDIMNAYGAAPPKPELPALAYEPHTNGAPQQTAAPPMVTPTYAENQVVPPAVPQYGFQNVVSPVSALSTPSNFASPSEQQYAPPQQDYPTNVAPEPQEEVQANPSDVMTAMQNLVNLEDITEQPEAAYEKARKQAEEQAKKETHKPLPPSAPAWHLGPQPSLADIKAHATPRVVNQDRPVMRTHAFDPAAAQAGMMVVYGSPPQPQQQPVYNPYGGMVPPPPPQPMGFAGAPQYGQQPAYVR